MTQIPAGWYPDPDTSNPSASQDRRYWDGQRWTEHVAQPMAAPPAYAGGTGPAATTPDGQLLAGWWQRVAAYLIDLVILTPLIFIAAWPWMTEIVSAFSDLMSEAIEASRTGASPPDGSAVESKVADATMMVTLVGLAMSFVYHVGFLKWKAATPGKLVLGLRVRLRETPGPLSWGTVLKRWLGQNWYAAASPVPVLGALLSLYPLLDVLWPLWDSKKQALHDKVARTNVVRQPR